ncbi:MAG: hypothetical protein FWC50_05415 [Planctomycetaceae bacterium]|nr:hypothetical protein [Planctomycetaceae bacterium]
MVFYSSAISVLRILQAKKQVKDLLLDIRVGQQRPSEGKGAAVFVAKKGGWRLNFCVHTNKMPNNGGHGVTTLTSFAVLRSKNTHFKTESSRNCRPWASPRMWT